MKFWNRLDRQYLKVCGYAVATAAAIIALVLVAQRIEPICDGIWGAVSWILNVIKPVVFGLVIAYIIYPICRFYEKRIHKHSAAVGCTVLTILVLLAIVGTVLMVALTRQMSGFSLDGFAEMMNVLYAELTQFVSDIRQWLLSMDVAESTIFEWEESLYGILYGLIDKLTANAGNLFGKVKSGASTGLFAVMFAVYFLLDVDNLKKYWGNVVRTLWSDRVNQGIAVITRDIDTAFSGYFRGQSIDALFMAVVIIISFSIAGVKYGALIGVLTGLGNLIPYLGPILGYGLTILAGLITGDIKAMIIGIIIIAIIQGIDGTVVNPKLLSTAIQIHPMLVLVALIAGGEIGGIVGMLVAVPCAAILKIWFERYVLKQNADAEEKTE